MNTDYYSVKDARRSEATPGAKAGPARARKVEDLLKVIRTLHQEAEKDARVAESQRGRCNDFYFAKGRADALNQCGHLLAGLTEE